MDNIEFLEANKATDEEVIEFKENVVEGVMKDPATAELVQKIEEAMNSHINIGTVESPYFTSTEGAPNMHELKEVVEQVTDKEDLLDTKGDDTLFNEDVPPMDTVDPNYVQHEYLNELEADIEEREKDKN